MSIRLCLFDLDNTLLRTSDLSEFRGQENISNATRDYTHRLLRQYDQRDDRLVYSPRQLADLQNELPNIIWGVFTRAPRHYATTLLERAYPGIEWGIVIAYEDVQNTKPHPDGIFLAARKFGIRSGERIALVGDEKSDVICAYRAGCWVFVDKSSWQPMEKEHWRALERVPDALFEGANQLRALLEAPHLGLPELEYMISGERLQGRRRRIDKINHFWPWGMRSGHVSIHILGRFFSDYEEIRIRKAWHELTRQIIEHKDAETFPGEWIEAIQGFLHLDTMGKADTVVTVVPFKPNRAPRLERLLSQLAASYQPARDPMGRVPAVTFYPDVLAFRQGAVSSHGNHLNADERFSNVGANLHVARADDVRGKHVVVIDDVVTTGATLLWSHRYLVEAGAQSVSCLSLAKAIGAN